MEISTELEFRNKLSLLHSNNKKVGLLTKEEYYQLIEDLKQASILSSSKTNREYYILTK